MNSLEDLQQEIKEIKKRNKKVEMDKAWETSLTRKIIISLLTYIIIVVFLYSVNLSKPFINAIVPAVAFFLSTLTIGFFKERWIKTINKREK